MMAKSMTNKEININFIMHATQMVEFMTRDFPHNRHSFMAFSYYNRRFAVDSQERGAEIPFRPIREHGGHIAGIPGGQLPRRPNVGPRADAHQQAVFLA